MRLVITVLVTAVLAAAVGLASCQPATVPVAVTSVAGTDLAAALAKKHGQPMLINLWAMWCAPCVAELPELEKVREEFEPKGVAVLGLCVEGLDASTDMTKAADRLPRFLARRDLGFEVWLYGGRSDAPIFSALPLPRPRSAAGIPMTLAVDATGKVVDFIEGQATAEQFEELARKLL